MVLVLIFAAAFVILVLLLNHHKEPRTLLRDFIRRGNAEVFAIIPAKDHWIALGQTLRCKYSERPVSAPGTKFFVAEETLSFADLTYPQRGRVVVTFHAGGFVQWEHHSALMQELNEMEVCGLERMLMRIRKEIESSIAEYDSITGAVPSLQ